FSVAANGDEAFVLGEALQTVARVPFVGADRPIGTAGTGRWLAAVGRATDREDMARHVHAGELADLSGLLQSKPLAGVRVHVAHAPATALALADLVKELGGHVTSITLDHVDRLHLDTLRALATRDPDVVVHVGDGQAFEEVNLLSRQPVDLYAGAGLHVAQIARTGRPVLFLPRVPLAGYAGVR
ncbi:nitrogenase component 1, partial [Rhodoplanes sp. SY1]|uniref:nitrogenase component 1 n=1 Tax=Rhodoplanes sp. SY1 TaxID=3166646 RepID=UPI0038B634B2